MPAYRTHVSLNLFLGLPLSLAALKYTVASTPTDMAYFAAAFLYGTLFFHFRHRGLSHMPIVGTLSRVAWVLGLIWVISSLLGWALPDWSGWNAAYICFGVGGLAVADLLHVFLDQVVF